MLRDIRIIADEEEPLVFTYIGLEMKGQTVYAYMEADLQNAPEKLTVSNEMFLRLVPGQINRVMAVKGKERRGDDVTAEKPVVSLDFTRPQPAPSNSGN